MYKRILVPLDGSKLAECALPYAEELAKGCGSTAEVILVSVTERVLAYTAFDDPDSPLGQRFVPEAVGKQEQPARKYLDRTAKQMRAKGTKVDTQVLIGHPAGEIVSYAANPGCDIIVMSSHGRSGPSRWAYGSIADRVFRATCVPVLMVRAPGCVPGI
jgi:nucleotide-binding universal stress UspA family protein